MSAYHIIELLIELEIIFSTKMMKKFYTNNIYLTCIASCGLKLQHIVNCHIF